jgi:hypothetical protein
VKRFLDEAPVDAPEKKSLLEDLQHFYSLSDGYGQFNDEAGVRLFDSVLLWAPFALSGPGAQVHPQQLVEPVKGNSTKKKQKPRGFMGFFTGKKGKQVHAASTDTDTQAHTDAHTDAHTHTPGHGIESISDSELKAEARLLRREGGVELADAADAELKRRRQAKVDEVKRR